VHPWASCSHTHTHVPLSPSSINLVPAQTGKVTVGLTSHWPCVTDNSGISTYGLTVLEREMSTRLRSSSQSRATLVTLPYLRMIG